MPDPTNHCRWCVDDSPLQQLLESLKHNNLRLPELLGIENELWLTKYIDLYWLIPIGADTSSDMQCPYLLNGENEGLAKMNSGETMLDFMPLEIEDFEGYSKWHHEHFLNYITPRMEKVRALQSKINSSEAPEDKLLAEWFKGTISAAFQAFDKLVREMLMENPQANENWEESYHGKERESSSEGCS